MQNHPAEESSFALSPRTDEVPVDAAGPQPPAATARNGADALVESPADPGLETSSLPSRFSLSPSQCRALENLMGGMTIGDAAAAADVSRRTLHRWLHEDTHFIAALNAWQKETVTATQASILALTQPAIRAIAAALEKGNSKTALTVLHSLGILTAPTPGPTNVEEVRRDRKIEKERRETNRLMAEMEAGSRR